ncbi:MAG: cystathionine beta-lyase [Aquisalinus sp.]|nr:cystathionine beta-lyase [Aquisalinus sp.]
MRQKADEPTTKRELNTGLAASGRPAGESSHPVNQPVERASTILFPTYEAFTNRHKEYIYGRFGTRSHKALCDSISELEGGDYTHLMPSGLAAITTCLMAFTDQSSHILATDSCYDPVRSICDRFLSKYGVETEYYNPRAGKKIASLIRSETKLILCESPGSLTFEIQDIPAIVHEAEKQDIPVMVDNTWSAGYFFRPLAVGASVSIQSVTKYIGGHADCLMGSVTCNDTVIAKKIERTARQLGHNVSADDAYLAQRGLRSLGARLGVHEANALKLADWLAEQPEVTKVLHPAREDHPDHALWKRDFSGSSGLFGFTLGPCSEEALARFCNTLQYFGMGYSWGGFESLLIPCPVEEYRSAVPWSEEGHLMRIHAGLEDIDDLVNDLRQAFAKLRTA